MSMKNPSAINLSMPGHLITFVSPRYWPDMANNKSISQEIVQILSDSLDKTPLTHTHITSEENLQAFLSTRPEGAAIFIPMSGSVQPWMQQAAVYFDLVGIFPGYDQQVMPAYVANSLLTLNAAPACMEMFAVLKNNKRHVIFIMDPDEFLLHWRAAQAVYRLKRAKLLQIGNTESWVLSSERNVEVIKNRIGIRIKQIPLEELYDYFQQISDEAAMPLALHYIHQAHDIIEPSEKQIITASRLIVAFEQLLQVHQADGAAIACFELLARLNTTSCLALSYLNDHPDFIGGCEGDLDSAITLALLKALTAKPGWMGNPIVKKGFALELVHCTAALKLNGAQQPFELRSHHESGIGVSPEVHLPIDKIITLCRLSVRESKMSAFTGKTVTMPPSPTCRTQCKIQLQEMPLFMKYFLGLHQTLVFGDYTRELAICADLLGLDFIGSQVDSGTIRSVEPESLIAQPGRK